MLAEIQPFRGLLLGLFFMSMGMSLNLDLLFDSPMMSIGLMLLLVAVKIAILFPLAYIFRLGTKNSLAIALVLGQSGEFALVLFSLAYASNVLTEELFQYLLLIVLLSMLVTPILANIAQCLVREQCKVKDDKSEAPKESPIVLVGFGRVGHRIGEILTRAKIPFVALDYDANVVEKERENGHPVYYGDVRKPELLKAVGVKDARIIIMTLNDPEASEQLIASLRKSHPDIEIYARGHSMMQCRKMHDLGATKTVSENVEASLELSRLVLKNIGMAKSRRESIIDRFRRDYYKRIVGKD